MVLPTLPALLGKERRSFSSPSGLKIVLLLAATRGIQLWRTSQTDPTGALAVRHGTLTKSVAPWPPRVAGAGFTNPLVPVRLPRWVTAGACSED